jgi:hypothetical protein
MKGDTASQDVEVNGSHSVSCFIDNYHFLQPGEMEAKYNGLLEKKWTSVIRLQKKV